MEILDGAERRQDCNERPDPEAGAFMKKREEIPRGRALINEAMCQCANVSMRRCGDVAMGQWGNGAMCQLGNVSSDWVMDNKKPACREIRCR